MITNSKALELLQTELQQLRMMFVLVESHKQELTAALQRKRAHL
jgi:hypothetical protein